jgi:hypothetical protein
VGVVDNLTFVPAVDIGRDEVHGPRAVQRHRRDDILELVWLELPEHALHARAFELENARGVPVPDELVGESVIYGQGGNIQVESWERRISMVWR